MDALKPFWYHIGKGILNALFDILENNDLDAMAKYEVKCLYNQIKNFKFLFFLVWLLNHINLVNKLMQTKNLIISEALILLKRLLIYFEYLRFNDDEYFEQFIFDTTELL